MLIKNITNDIIHIGINDRTTDLFEGMYRIDNGVAYNSYVILDEKIAVTDTVDCKFGNEWLNALDKVLQGKTPDYLVVNHMEPDHSANIARFAQKYANAKIVGNAKTFAMIQAFFGTDFADRRVVVTDGETLSLGKHSLTFTFAPMVHWPEVMVAFDSADGVLFSADAFGKFGDHDAVEPWTDEARRYYYGIVGKFGMPVQTLLKKLGGLAVKTICPLHGPILTENLGEYIGLYDKWSKYQPEIDGVLIAYTSVYGNTKKAAELLKSELDGKGVTAKLVDLARTEFSFSLTDAFTHSKLVIATTTYNGDIFTAAREFIDHIKERNYQNRLVGIIENGSWAATAAKQIKERLEKCKGITFTETTVSVKSSLDENSIEAIKTLANELSNK